MIKFENVTMAYRKDGHPALNDVSFEIADGEFVFLVGQSGAGKSTILRLLIREEKAQSGNVLIDDINIGELREKEVPKLRRNIGMVFQDFRLLPEKTISENVAFALQVLNKTPVEIKQTVPVVLDLVGLLDKANRKPEQLSGGEQQRVAIARALVNRPAILMADEPSGNLDPDTTIEIMRLLDQINKAGTTVIMATHDAGIVDQMRKRVIEITNGAIIRDQVRGVYGYS
ncbi:MAG: cell division ATP-binding protein FtsE [Actinomycetota bacterium]|nr:cell division ATP-binding protein FtsE [Actinomycetota bacterium]MDA3026705.1 cell division ATP-binding protein FtsE [Actinomycetota bacterium]